MTDKNKDSGYEEHEKRGIDLLAFFRSPTSRPPRNGDFIAVALLSGFITFLIYIVIASGDLRTLGQPFNFGFGPNMDCRYVGSLEPVCTAKP